MTKKISVRTYFIIASALTLASVILRTAAIFWDFDAEIGYFNNGILSLLGTVLPIISIIALIFLAFFLRPVTASTEMCCRFGRRVYILISSIVILLISVVFEIFNLLQFSRNGSIDLLLFITGIPAAAYYLLAFLDNDRRKIFRPVAVMLGFFVIFWALLAIGYTYFDNFVQMNSPIKLIIQFGLISVMFSTLSDLRVLLGRPCPRSAILSNSLTMFLGYTAAFPIILRSFKSRLSDPHYSLMALALLWFAVFSVNRLADYIVSNKNCPNHSAKEEHDLRISSINAHNEDRPSAE